MNRRARGVAICLSVVAMSALALAAGPSATAYVYGSNNSTSDATYEIRFASTTGSGAKRHVLTVARSQLALTDAYVRAKTLWGVRNGFTDVIVTQGPKKDKTSVELHAGPAHGADSVSWTAQVKTSDMIYGWALAAGTASASVDAFSVLHYSGDIDHSATAEMSVSDAGSGNFNWSVNLTSPSLSISGNVNTKTERQALTKNDTSANNSGSGEKVAVDINSVAQQSVNATATYVGNANVDGVTRVRGQVQLNLLFAIGEDTVVMSCLVADHDDDPADPANDIEWDYLTGSTGVTPIDGQPLHPKSRD